MASSMVWPIKGVFPSLIHAMHVQSCIWCSHLTTSWNRYISVNKKPTRNQQNTTYQRIDQPNMADRPTGLAGRTHTRNRTRYSCAQHIHVIYMYTRVIVFVTTQVKQMPMTRLTRREWQARTKQQWWYSLRPSRRPEFHSVHTCMLIWVHRSNVMCDNTLPRTYE